MTLEDEIIKELSTQMQSEMDFQILSDMLVQLGWTKIVLPRFYSREHSVDVLGWCEKNIKNPYERRGTVFMFQHEDDAVLFSLKWI